MLIKASCPTCGRVEEYTPDEGDLKVAEERGVASISFNHGDHIFVVFFDVGGRVRRTTVLKVVARPVSVPRPAEAKPVRTPEERVKVAPPMPFDDLCSLLGEKLAMMLIALISGARVVLASSSLDLARSVCSTVRELVKPVEVLVEEALGPDELRSALGGPGGVVITEHTSLIEVGEAPSHIAIVDLEVPVKLSRKERKGLRVMLKALKKARGLRDEATKVAFIRSKALRLRTLMEKALAILGEVDRIGETAFKRKIDPAITPEELDALYFALERFMGIDVSKRVIRGPAEFVLKL